jgi:Uma2 family endonuclease
MGEVLCDVKNGEVFNYRGYDDEGDMVREMAPSYHRLYTYDDFITWPDEFRAEVVEGEIFTMPPPKVKHQDAVLEIAAQVKAYLKGKPHKVCVAPIAVRLFPRLDGKDKTVFEPDVVVIKDMSIVEENGIAGVPDMLVEVLSPASALYDRTVKFNFYERAGVGEYWIVDLDQKTVSVFLLHEGKYKHKTYQKDEKVALAVFPDCIIDLASVFE